MGILAATLLGCAQPEPLKPAYPLITRMQSDGQTIEICKLTETSSSVDKAMAGGKVEYSSFYKSPVEAKRDLSISLQDIVSDDGQIKTYERFEVLIIPIGFENASSRLDPLTRTLQQAFKGINVHFIYAKKSIPLDVESVERYGKVTESQYLEFEKELALPYSGIAFVVNSDQHMGAHRGPYSVSAIERYDGASTTIHEMGHMLSLEDEYSRYYGKESLESEKKIPGLFLEFSSLDPDFKKMILEQNIPIVTTQNLCEGKPVYALYPQKNIMRGLVTDQDLEKMLAQKESIFNPLQYKMMNDFIVTKIKK